MPYTQFLDDFSMYMRKHGRKTSTITRYRYDLALFLKWLQKHQEVTHEVLRSLTDNDIQMYLESLKRNPRYAPSTLKQKYGYIKVFLEYYDASIETNTQVESKLKERNFATDQDVKVLLSVMQSYEGLSEYQATGRQYIINRNVLLVHFMLNYGLSISDITTLSMNDVNLGTGTIRPGKETAFSRQIQLYKEDQKLLFTYYKEIPEILRPRQHSDDALFVAFDFARLTFRWDYKNNSPKPLTKRSIQEMLKKESKRANINITPTNLRNRFILNALRNNIDPLEIKLMLGFKTDLSLNPYIDFFNELRAKNKILNYNT